MCRPHSRRGIPAPRGNRESNAETPRRGRQVSRRDTGGDRANEPAATRARRKSQKVGREERAAVRGAVARGQVARKGRPRMRQIVKPRAATSLTPGDFAKLRLSQFIPAAEIHALRDWEFMDLRWVGEAVGFTE